MKAGISRASITLIEGYDANDINGYSQCSAIELVRKDGRKPAAHKPEVTK